MTRLILAILLILLVEGYSLQFARSIFKDFSSWIFWLAMALHLAATLGTYFGVVWGLNSSSISHSMRYYLFTAVILLFIPKLLASTFLVLADLVRLAEWGITAAMHSEPLELAGRRPFVRNIAIGLFALPFFSMVYGMVKTAFDFKVLRNKVPISDLPDGLNGMRILQISDIHSGSFASEDLLAKAFDLIEKEQVDLIVFTGDLVNNVPSEAEPFINQFKRLKAPLGVYSILGNHDYGDYVAWPSDQAKTANLNTLIALHRKAGWDILLNQNRIIERNGSKFALLGVENWGAALRFPKYGKLNEALRGVESMPIKVLLSHDPSHWDAEVRAKHPDIKLTLSGHTHGFQFGIEIPGFKWSPVQYVYKQWAGLYEQAGQYIHVNRGLGFIGYMGRIGIAPEITILELVKA